MKRFGLLTTGFAVLAMTLLVMQDSSQASISGSKHDFSSFGWSNGRICVVCHTPHNGDTTVDAPLWNHETTTATFTLYSSPTLDAAPGQPTGVSKLCLSCHDGTVAVDSYAGATGTAMMAGIDPASDVGTDLSNDHPVSFTYDSALAATDGELTDPAADGDTDPDTVGAAAPFLPLWGGEMQCSSCHDVHNTATADDYLLIKSRTGSALCLTCHLK